MSQKKLGGFRVNFLSHSFKLKQYHIVKHGQCRNSDSSELNSSPIDELGEGALV